MAFNPFIAALLLSFRESGTDGANRFLRGILHFDRSKVGWYALAVLAMPLIMAATYLLMNLAAKSVHYPHISILIPPLVVRPILCPRDG
jgi:hypothetical protein